MMYALNLADDKRILSVTYAKYASSKAVLVETIPEENACDYRYVDGEYIYDPLPQPVEPPAEPSTDDVLNALLGVNE